MAYEAQRNDENQEIRNIKNNTENVRNAAKIAQASGLPYASQVGAAINTADKVTGGKASEELGKGINEVTKRAPGGNQVQNKLNQINEKDGDKIASLAKGANAMNGVPPIDNQQNLQSIDENGANNAQATGSVRERETDEFGGSGPSSFFGSSRKTKEQKEQYGEAESDPTEFKVFSDAELKAFKIVLPAFGSGLILILLVMAVLMGGIADFDDAFGISYYMDENTGGVNYEATSKETKKLYERIEKVHKKFEDSGKYFDTLNLMAVFHVLYTTDNRFDYDYMTESRLTDIANLMFKDGVYDEETFRQNLTEKLFKKYFPKMKTTQHEKLTNEVFKYIEFYKDLVGEETDCTVSTSCSYNLEGFYEKGKGNVKQKINASNIKVQVTSCGAGSIVSTVTFEDYIMGVLHAETTNDVSMEALKAYAIATRNYALTKNIVEENDSQVIKVSGCASDQKYCDIKEGCSKSTGSLVTKDKLDANSKIRTAVDSTKGEVLVNDQGYAIKTTNASGNLKNFTSLANAGKDYKQILIEVYNSANTQYGASDIKKMSCDNSKVCSSASGPYTNWKQYEGPWANVQLGSSGKTLKQIGCLTTSLAILIAKSGVKTNISDFNPGTFAEAMSKNGAYDSGGSIVSWTVVSKIAPGFKYVSTTYVSGYTKQQKLNILKDLLNQGYYVTAEVMGDTGQHWVAIDSIQGDKVNIIDPGDNKTDLWAGYNWQNTSKYVYYKAEK